MSGGIDTPLSAHSPRRWRAFLVKLIGTLVLYAIVFYRVDAGALASRLASVRIEYVALGVLLYVAGQVASAWRWHLLLAPVRLHVTLPRLTGFYFTGMFFNLFLPTIVGGDAVKAVLLSRETGAPVRATLSVFMERNIGLLALLSIAVVAAWMAPPIEIAGLPVRLLTMMIAAAFVAVNAVLLSASAYRLVDSLVEKTPLWRYLPRAASFYDAVAPYKQALSAVALATLLSFLFQAVLIVVVFLNARALDHVFPLTALAVFVPLISLAGMVPISVNGLGVREALYLLLFGLVGAPADVAVSLALLYFAVTVVASLPGGLIYLLQRRRPRLAEAGHAVRS
jgi:glycosyltransferase 2 family protein